MSKNNSKTEEPADLVALVDDARSITIFTGAGISTESGIPDFRSPNGIWSKIVPIQFDDFIRSEEARLEDWRRRFIMNGEFDKAVPNEGHLALVRLEEQGKLNAVITQNIDGMHQKSGLPTDAVIELHGNSTYGTCLNCAKRHELESVQSSIENTSQSPICDICGSLVKAAVISFGQSMPEREMQQAFEASTSCDLCIVLGSSLVVHPAAQFPQIAVQNGAKLAIINREPTPLDHLATLVIHAEIGEALTPIGR